MEDTSSNSQEGGGWHAHSSPLTVYAPFAWGQGTWVYHSWIYGWKVAPLPCCYSLSYINKMIGHMLIWTILSLNTVAPHYKELGYKKVLDITR